MKTAVCISVIIFLCFLPNLTSGQIIGSEIYPTEDELYEAYLIGQFDYQTYLNLLEILNSGIDAGRAV